VFYRAIMRTIHRLGWHHMEAMPIIDAALSNIDRERARLRKEHERAMAKLDADERDLLGMKP
jgi:hypothetical protein